MKNSDVEKLTVYDFVRLLTELNYNFIKEVYSSFEWALEHYKEELKESGKDNLSLMPNISLILFLNSHHSIII
jgi:hypothetical protein